MTVSPWGSSAAPARFFALPWSDPLTLASRIAPGSCPERIRVGDDGSVTFRLATLGGVLCVRAAPLPILRPHAQYRARGYRRFSVLRRTRAAGG